jgi:hypothetical protein
MLSIHRGEDLVANKSNKSLDTNLTDEAFKRYGLSTLIQFKLN